MSESERRPDPNPNSDGKASEPSPNAAPDAVKDPNAKTEGRPGAAPQGDEVDPGGG